MVPQYFELSDMTSPYRSRTKRTEAVQGMDFELFMIVTPDFLPGALVTLSSFLKHHPEPRRRVYILQRDLTEQHRECLKTLSFDYVFCDHDPELARRAALLPIFPERRNRLLVLQAFQVIGDKELLVLDADLLIQGSLLGLMEHPGDLVGSGESLHLRGGWRCPETLAPKDGTPLEGALQRTINTGVFRLAPSLRTGQHYRDLLDRLDPDWWAGLETDLTDQALLNHHFRELIQVAHPGYNFVLQYKDIFQSASGMTPQDCPVLHFAGPVKPWVLHSVTDHLEHYLEPARRWTDEWLRVMGLLNS